MYVRLCVRRVCHFARVLINVWKYCGATSRTKMDYPACNSILVEIYLRSKWLNRNHFCAKGRRNVFVIRAWYLLIPKFRSDSIIRESISRRLSDSCKKSSIKERASRSIVMPRRSFNLYHRVLSDSCNSHTKFISRRVTERERLFTVITRREINNEFDLIIILRPSIS